MATFTASLEHIHAWRGSRMPAARFVPLALLVAWAGVAAGAADAAHVGGAFVLAYTLIAQFRLWDDIADRARDAREHPQRTIAVGPLLAASAALAVFNVVALGAMNGGSHAVAVLVLGALVLAWYRMHRARGLVHAFVLLLKYPVFAALLAAPAAPVAPLVFAAVLVYCALCGFELLDDPGLRRAAGGRSHGSAPCPALRYLPFLLAAIGLVFITVRGMP